MLTLVAGLLEQRVVLVSNSGQAHDLYIMAVRRGLSERRSLFAAEFCRVVRTAHKRRSGIALASRTNKVVVVAGLADVA